MSIIGVGIDQVSIARIEQALARFGKRFEARLFTERERALAHRRRNPARRFAMMFAAKEAAAKALGVGFRGASPKEFEVRYLATGAPIMQLSGRAKAWAERLGVERVLISLADDAGCAVAMAMAVGCARRE